MSTKKLTCGDALRCVFIWQAKLLTNCERLLLRELVKNIILLDREPDIIDRHSSELGVWLWNLHISPDYLALLDAIDKWAEKHEEKFSDYWLNYDPEYNDNDNREER